MEETMDYTSGYLKGFKDGLEAFAWWKDGVCYVGTTGMTLKEALAKADRGEIWNQRGI